MEIREIELKAEKLGTRSLKIKRVKEKWSAVKFGDKEFLMTKDLSEYFTRKIYHGSIFHLHFDNDKVITDDPYHIPATANREAVKEYRFIVLDENVELWNPEKYTLITKENGLALYTTDDDRILYRKGKEYTVAFRYDKRINSFYRQTVIFDVEKPLNEETFNLIKKLHDKRDRTIHVRCNLSRGTRFEIEIFEDHLNDINVYVGKNHYLLALDNAEIIRFIEYGREKLIAIKGDKTYVELDRKRQSNDECNYHKDEKGMYITYISRYRMFDYDFNPINILKTDRNTVIFEIPSLDADITVRKFIINVKPMLIDTYPKTWHYEKLEPKMVGEKTYKIRDLVRKLSDEDRNPYDYKTDISLSAHV